MSQALRLGVNVDHVATLRQARGVDYPSPLEAALCCRQAGAHGITVHLREDRRHIQDHDVLEIHGQVELPLNLEMAVAPEIVAFAQELRPAECCLVPERREEVTTEGGLDAAGQEARLREPVGRLLATGIAVSLFLDPEAAQLEAAARLGVPVVELHTGAFCDATGAEAQRHLDLLRRGAERAHQLGLQVNAGHGIALHHVPAIRALPHLDTLNIGHSIVARAVFVGMQAAVAEMLQAMREE